MFKTLLLVFVRSALIILWFLGITPLVEANMTKSPADESSHPFDVWEFRIEGNTILDNQVIEKTVYQFLGNNKNIATVEEARGALEKAYHDAGYQAALVDIPEQDVREGVVILKVTEGNVDRLRVTGSRYFSPGHIKEKVPALTEGKPLNLPEAQKELTKLAAESPDRQVTPVMRAGTTPGTIDIDLEVKDELPVHGSVELNARNSINTTRLRLPVMLRYDNLWQLNHSASLQYQVSPEDTQNVQVWSGTYVMPIDVIGSRLAMYGIGLDSSSDVTTAGSLNVVGNGNIFGLRLNKPLEENKDIIQTLSFGWDYKDFGQSINPIGDTSQPGQSSPVQYSPFQLGYSASLYQEGGSLSQLNTELNFNFAGMGSSYEQFAKRRYGATPNYFYLAGEVKHKQALPEDLALQVRLSGQVANEPLISNEQMGAGGMLTVRGYHEVERLGDNGVVGSMEFWSPDFGDMGLDGLEYLNDFRMLAFTDAAQLWLIDPLPGTDTGYDLFSSGAGFRLRAFRGLVSELYWEYPFVGTQYVQPGQQRIDFRVAYEF
ncbi:MAG: ShlB/FhaC/HecB family hemolysin secretion/activation protein [Gammaproteobacteria bacterium]|jgi:hemolysin activation/secretion protein|nr:ShlB/FhaC/HecB family hemolysin secretion/activation protein [Gammaproteobacteria bacterium]